ncbi:hypothetical protein ABVT39_004733 [Epinephelus coioides]
MNQLSEAAFDCKDSASLAKFIENVLSNHFQEADDFAKERFSWLEKKVNTMQSTLNRQAEQLKSLHNTVGKIDSRVIKLETDCVQYQTNLVKYEDKLTQLEDRAHRDNILLINLKEGIESSSARQYSLANIPKCEATSKKRKPCYPVLNGARKAGFQAFLLYPARMSQNRAGERYAFEDVAKASAFLDSEAPNGAVGAE